MNVGLFIPCYVDQFYPQVARATLQLLESLGCTVAYPLDQTCCGQPMANAGYAHLTDGCNQNFIRNFSGFDYIVAPSGSCTLHIKHHLHGKGDTDERAAQQIQSRIYELTEFLTDVLRVESLPTRLPQRTVVGLHQSCHGQRGLNLAPMSELMREQGISKPAYLLRLVEGLELVDLDRRDECCGFGGTFCVTEEAISVKMGKDRLADHQRHGVEVITGVDVSCLMHLQGILRRQKSSVQVKHIAELLVKSEK
ncbi:(Fe-S)-binding protein [Spirosoma montaniterrae]|uniref:Fe-S oxidoreductase n=1 Tax=Spirosoma montaniterrae TaxID=1178516 RepID=A0A1P9WZL5_9BACT|nr:(Fe-S)-binding protein [Spirosoma montaniterrae]AQG80826.1 Fe-S oxidoreductase [Spirosoma montaniterrae]